MGGLGFDLHVTEMGVSLTSSQVGGIRGGLEENQDFVQFPVITRNPIVSVEAIYETGVRFPVLSSKVVSGES